MELPGKRPKSICLWPLSHLVEVPKRLKNSGMVMCELCTPNKYHGKSLISGEIKGVKPGARVFMMIRTRLTQLKEAGACLAQHA